MSEGTAKTVVLVSGFLMFAVIFIKRSSVSDPFRYAWAAGVITLFLSLLADITPQVAGPAALLALLAVYAKNKGVLGKVLPAGASVPPSVSGSFQNPSGGTLP